MLMWLAAADPQPRGSTFVDWVPLIGALLVFLGVFVSAYVARANARKPWYENLATLVQVHNDWPAGVHGKETIEQAIADMLAGIRVDTGRAGKEDATDAELEAEEHARHHVDDAVWLREFNTWVALPGTVVFLTALVFVVMYSPGRALTLISVTCLTWCVVVLCVVFVHETRRASPTPRRNVPPRDHRGPIRYP
ncbi:hypothetical protein A5780_22895 [Nocardia sp. 852002-20019_SCH5090214]|uniref:Uncharacterized protein n=1 Tax=Nocardia nova TaxID=37330 RepID=A0A2S6A4J2_9NOCA|nr:MULTISPECIES: hypothetical protein [Nocardia]OBF84953.1 hypothetical protein A9X06_13970 [Mycobacterium sp. 852002-51759_SCH5129042]MBF6271915.1 hypothetical protein [Nocardia nova]OBA42386.1 hypothetical protein A5789_13395 [Nocardia sp. 852002-51101_SCH5132738]OBA57119.1 hypothetical protein A5780_22895 [Nocardia sp. 852002-20019_SCH5090214]OBB49935.1 hypothetical protein A5748_18725 [Nocardia sp. 852002-51244_SCH5132740]